ncbi:hypothetical protein [Acinetobacter pittii]|uniref:hypothetical protein n=1 Tax=Acinetobacter pittii TaxID=48296 RepID=UPI00031B2D19|nr:hypothetical protein [Acinetobacter pittii]MDX8274098.1 hypothetical protein [Acinetobacter pittii]SSP24241.1 Uncharacterised protein [Acinetobacter pittii]
MIDWLPNLILLDDHRGIWQEFLDAVHTQFEQDFIVSKPTWPNKRVALKRHPETAQKSATFWHMISEGKVETERTPDISRCERIAWPRPMMDNFKEISHSLHNTRVIWWKEKRGTEDRYILALSDFSYVVVIADRGEFVLPWTAYCVGYNNQKRKYEKKWKEYWGI